MAVQRQKGVRHGFTGKTRVRRLGHLFIAGGAGEVSFEMPLKIVRPFKFLFPSKIKDMIDLMPAFFPKKKFLSIFIILILG